MALLSVCIPTINRPQLLERHIKHLVSFKSLDIEIAVSNNDATGETEAMLRRYAAVHPAIRYINQVERLPYWLNLDAAMRLATSKYLIHLADDDVAREAELAGAVKLLEANPSLIAVFGGHELIDMANGQHLGTRRFCDTAEVYQWANREALLARHWVLEHPVCRTDLYQRFIVVNPPTQIFHWTGISALLRIGAIAVVPEALYDHHLHRDRFTHQRAADAEWVLQWSSEVEQAVGQMLADSPLRGEALSAQLTRVYQFLAGVNASEGRFAFARFLIAKGMAHNPQLFSELARQWEQQFLLPMVAEVLSLRIRTAGAIDEVIVEASEVADWLNTALQSRLGAANRPPQVRIANAGGMSSQGAASGRFLVFRHPPGELPAGLGGRYSIIADLLGSLRLTQGDLNLSIPPRA
jgi:glycosyltransferase involved in cell wall biosynthesis